MRYWQCKCGERQGWGSTGPRPCDWCDECKTTLACGPDGHRIIRPPHKMIKTSVDIETDDGTSVATLTRCIHCHKTKADLEKNNEPMEDFVPDARPTGEVK